MPEPSASSWRTSWHRSARGLSVSARVDRSTPQSRTRPTALQLLGGQAHVVFDGVSRASTVALAIDILRKGGKLMTVGVPAGETPIRLDLVQDRELEIYGNLMYVREDVLHAIELLERQPFPIDEIVTATFPLDPAPRRSQPRTTQSR